MNIKKIFQIYGVASIFGAVLVAAPHPVHAAIVTVGAAHKYLGARWGIEVPHYAADSNIVSMKYLMQLVDAANEKLNRLPTSDYANDAKYATTHLAADGVARTAVDELVKEIEWHFFFTPETSDTEYHFSIGAAGTFYIDWGDGTRQKISKPATGAETISHTYKDAANLHEISLGGTATAYATTEQDDNSAITFKHDGAHVSKIRGCIGCVFSTLDNDNLSAAQRQPCFYQLFKDNTGLTGEIPEGLFGGLYGAPRRAMFEHVFLNCSNLTGTIPEKLFQSVQGIAASLFGATFEGCTKLSGPIPANLFKTIQGAPKGSIFHSTFRNCTGLTGEIPANLFSGITTDVVYPDKAFYRAFRNCTGLSGPSARINGRYLYEIWPDHMDITNGIYQETYLYDTQLSDYENIPDSWKLLPPE